MLTAPADLVVFVAEEQITRQSFDNIVEIWRGDKADWYYSFKALSNPELLFRQVQAEGWTETRLRRHLTLLRKELYRRHALEHVVYFCLMDSRWLNSLSQKRQNQLGKLAQALLSGAPEAEKQAAWQKLRAEYLRWQAAENKRLEQLAEASKGKMPAEPAQAGELSLEPGGWPRALRNAVDILEELDWPGPECSRAALLALLNLSARLNSETEYLRVSVRRLAELAALSRSSAARALDYLNGRFIRQVAHKGGGTDWWMLDPGFEAAIRQQSQVKKKPALRHKMGQLGIKYSINLTVPKSAISSTEKSRDEQQKAQMLANLWDSSLLGHLAERIYALLDAEPKTSKELATQCGFHRKTIAGKLKVLQSRGLAHSLGARSGWIRGAADLVEVARSIGAVEVLVKRKEQHAQERAQYHRRDLE